MNTLSPIAMLRRGIFGGSYFEMATDGDFEMMKPGIRRLAIKQCTPFDVSKNYYGVASGLHYTEWVARGWIFPEDPLGWFHWYCRWYSGRRHARDNHQLNRQRKYGERWGLRARNQYARTGKVSPVILQGLLQWGFDPDSIGE
jgi:hypothetical protein